MTKFAGPTMRYDPATGEGRVFHDSADVPAGWVDRLDDSGVAQSGDRPPVTRAELVAALEMGGVPFAKNASASKLEDLLRESLEKALREANKPFEPNTDVRDLLDLLTSP